MKPVSVAVLVVAAALTLCAQPAAAGSPQQWASRRIYQVLTDRFDSAGGSSSCNELHDYCGGDYKGLIRRLDYIKALGFDAIWISPILQQGPRGYHGYHHTSLTEVNTEFGSEADLHALVSECHKRGIWVMVDVVANHMGCPECANCMGCDGDISRMAPFDHPEHYHTNCQIHDWNDQHQVEMCRLANLPDLDQANPFVRQTLYDWIAGLVKKFNFDGVRLDTAPHVHPDFWPKFESSAGVYVLGEVFKGDMGYVSNYQNYLSGVFNYPSYFSAKDAFAYRHSMRGLRDTVNACARAFKNVNLLGSFADNHDNPRFRHFQQDRDLFLNYLTFTLTQPGIPVMYYGSELDFAGGADPDNREPMWLASNAFDLSHPTSKHVQALMKHYGDSKLYSNPLHEVWIDDQVYMYSRGTTLVIVQNGGSGSGEIQRTLTASLFPPTWKHGMTVCNIFYPDKDCITLGGQVDFHLLHGESKVYHPV